MGREKQWLKQYVETDDGYPNMDFEDWYQKGLFCHYFKFPSYLYRVVFSGVVSEWKTRSKPIRMWHIRAFVLGLSGDGRKCGVEDDYHWPIPPKGWDLMFTLFEGGCIEIDFAHPVSRIFWSEDNGELEQPRFKEGCTLDQHHLEELGIRYLTPFYTAAITQVKTTHLSSVK